MFDNRIDNFDYMYENSTEKKLDKIHTLRLNSKEDEEIFTTIRKHADLEKITNRLNPQLTERLSNENNLCAEIKKAGTPMTIKKEPLVLETDFSPSKNSQYEMHTVRGGNREFENDITVKPRIEKYNRAQQILEQQKEKINKAHFSTTLMSHHLSLSPNVTIRHKSHIAEELHLSQLKNELVSLPINGSKIRSRQKSTTDFPHEQEFDSFSKLSIYNFQENCEKEGEDIEELKTNSRLNLFTTLPQKDKIVSKFSEVDLMDEICLRNFITFPLQKSKWLRCKIERILCEKKVTKFNLILCDNGRQIMSVIRRPKKSYLFYMICDTYMLKEKNYLGKLKSNFFGTEFNSFDSGKKVKKDTNPDFHRLNLATVTYETNLFGLNGPRKMKVYMPEVNSSDNKPTSVKPVGPNDTLKKRYLNQKESAKKDNIVLFMNKLPCWSEKYNCYILDYKDRKIKQSVKNFQLLKTSPFNNDIPLDDEVCLQFGRTGEHSFILDFMFPFSPLQALSIALSSIHNKIACE